jgi:glycine hydroxymethyltransferase
LVRGERKLFDKVEKAVQSPPLLQSTFDLGTTIAAGIACTEMLEYGRDYARQVVGNARALGESLHKHGLQGLLSPHRGFTKSHMAIQKGRCVAQLSLSDERTKTDLEEQDSETL